MPKEKNFPQSKMKKEKHSDYNHTHCGVAFLEIQIQTLVDIIGPICGIQMIYLNLEMGYQK